MVDQGLWGEDKEQRYQKFLSDINEKEELLNAGGVKLSEAKEAALRLRELREGFKD